MKILVTGGSGHVGQAVIRALKEAEMEVVNLDRQRPQAWLCRFVPIDLTDAGEVYDVLADQRPNGVVHLAADPAPGGRARHKQFMQNVGIAHSIFQACGDLNVGRIVYASSEQANGWTSAGELPTKLPVDEECCTVPHTAYALSKYVGELILESVVATHPETVATSLRLNFVTNPETTAQIHEWHPEEYRSGNLWGYIDSRDVASAVLLSLKSERKGHRPYNISAEDTMCKVPTRDLLERWFGNDFSLPEDFPEFGSLVDCSRAAQELGWSPQHSWRIQST